METSLILLKPTGHRKMKKGLQSNPLGKFVCEPCALSQSKGKQIITKNQSNGTKCFDVRVTVNATSSANAMLMAIALQNVLNELGENQCYLLELVNTETVKQHSSILCSILDKPLVKSLLGI